MIWEGGPYAATWDVSQVDVWLYNNIWTTCPSNFWRYYTLSGRGFFLFSHRYPYYLIFVLVGLSQTMDSNNSQ